MKKKLIPVSLTIALVIAAGFILTVCTSLLSFQALFHKDVEIVSELTSENIYVNINNLMDRPINVSTSMAHDTFLQLLGRPEVIPGLRQPRAWLSSVAKGLMIDRIRRQRLENAY
ncbi:MAG: hypothetical protein RR843_09985, partial [Clostridia bacterium]